MEANSQATRPLPDETDLALLLNLISEKNESALAQLYDLSVNKVYGLALKILANEADAEEVVCDVYSQLWHKSADYQTERGSAISWLLVICRSRALDLLRKKRPEYLSDDTVNELADTARHPLPEDIISQLEEGSAIKSAMFQLSDIQRQLIALAFFKDLSHAEISSAIQLPLGTVKSHIRRALHTMNTLIEL